MSYDVKCEALVKVVILENGRYGCCFCGQDLNLAERRNPGVSPVIMPPMIGDCLVCEPCFIGYQENQKEPHDD